MEGPATPEMIAAVEAEIAALDGPFEMETYDALCAAGRIETFDLRAAYTDLLRQRLDLEAIKAAGVRVAYDAMYGAGMGIVTDLLGAPRTVELHHDLNPGMKGQAPEPIERNLAGLMEAVPTENCAMGMATDGDADRIGLVDEEGTFVDSHKILALLTKYLYQEKDLSGSVVKTFSTTDMLDKIGKAYRLDVETTPIGFKYIAPKMVEGDVLVGGEESGGIAVKGHVPERDGLYIGLTVLEMIVKRERTLSGLVRELMDEFGPHYQSRSDLHTTPEAEGGSAAATPRRRPRPRRRPVRHRHGDAGRVQVPGRERLAHVPPLGHGARAPDLLGGPDAGQGRRARGRWRGPRRERAVAERASGGAASGGA